MRTSFRAALTHRVTLHHMATVTVDEYGNEIRSEARAERDVPARVDFVATDESIIDRDEVLDTYLVILPGTVSIEATDEITWDGVRMKVDGQPMRVDDRLGVHHFEVAARRVTG